VLGATYRGCDLLGELAENVKVDIDESAAVRMNNVEEQQVADVQPKPLKTSLRRSLSLVLLPELVMPLTLCDDKMPLQSRVDRCSVDVDRHVSSEPGCDSKERAAAVDVVDRDELRFDLSLDDSVAEIPPLSQRLLLNQLQMDCVVKDCVSTRKPAAGELPSSDDIAARRKDDSENFCLKKSSQRAVNSNTVMTDSVSGRKSEELPSTVDIAGTRENSRNSRLKKSSQRTGKSDSALLLSRRREAMMLRTAAILSDDVFLEAAKLSGVTTIPSCREKDAKFDWLNQLKYNAAESEIIQRFQSSFRITGKSQDLDSVENCLPECNRMSESSGEFVASDNCPATDAVFSSVDTPTDHMAPVISVQPFSGPSVWSPRHCGNFRIETSITDTPNADSSDRNKNILQVRTLPICDKNSLTNTCSSDPPVTTDNDRNLYTDPDEVSSNGDPIDVSELLFDDPDSPEDNSVLSLDAFVEKHCGISASNSGNTHCDEGNYSVIVID